MKMSRVVYNTLALLIRAMALKYTASKTKTEVKEK